MSYIKDTIRLEVRHDAIYRIAIGINSDGPRDQCDLFIPVTLPIDQHDIPNSTYGFLRSLFGLMLSSIIICRLGTPWKREKVTVQIDGSLPRRVKGDVECILSNFMVSRAILSNKCPAEHIEVEIEADFMGANVGHELSLHDNKVILAFSGGMDSTSILRFYRDSGIEVTPVFAKYESNKHSDVQRDMISAARILDYMGLKEEAVNVGFILDEVKRVIPWQTRMYDRWYYEDPNPQDLDDWDYYGRNAVITAILLFLCVSKQAKYIALGHTPEGLFSTQRHRGIEFYDRCCASIYFVHFFNKVLDKLFGKTEVALIAPLMNMDKIAMTKYLLGDPKLFSLTHSCISGCEVEDGICFSCFDRLTGILASVPAERLKVAKSGDVYNLYVDSHCVSSVKWIPHRNDSSIWGKQLLYYCNASEEDRAKMINGIYDPRRIVGALKNIRKNDALWDVLPREFEECRARCEHEEQKGVIKASIITPLEFVRTYKERFDRRLVATRCRNVEGTVVVGFA